ncbi:hypothetical protein MKHDV_00068 [Halodesulfovibrio sp. MK-HDV]|nr:hypothetical protein MKHDV_00068 [Halodesulfovibrio sp. MK-HDV]
MSSFELFSILVVTLYCLGALSVFTGSIVKNPKLKHLSNALTICGFGLHTVLLGYAMAINGWALPSGYYISMLSWSLLLIYFFIVVAIQAFVFVTHRISACTSTFLLVHSMRRVHHNCQKHGLAHFSGCTLAHCF